MKLVDRINLFYEEEYGVKNIVSLDIVSAIDKLNYNPSSNKLYRYYDLFNLMKGKYTLKENLGILFLRGEEFPSDLKLVIFARDNRCYEGARIFLNYNALKEEDVADRIEEIYPNYPKIFLRKALEHKLNCENPNLWEKPDDDISHLRVLSRIATKLFFLEEDLNEKIKLLELNYGVLLRKGDPTRKEYDKGLHYLRRLSGCTSKLATCYFKKGEFEKSKKYANYSLDYLLELKNLLKLKNEYFDIEKARSFIIFLRNNKELFLDHQGRIDELLNKVEVVEGNEKVICGI